MVKRAPLHVAGSQPRSLTSLVSRAIGDDGFVGRAGELGQVMSQEEVGEAMQQLYGDTKARTARLAESAAQLQAEAAVHSNQARRQSSNSGRPGISPSPPPNHGSIGTSPHPAMAVSQPQKSLSHAVPAEIPAPEMLHNVKGSDPARAGTAAATSTSRRIVPQAVGTSHVVDLRQAGPSLVQSSPAAFMTAGSKPVPAGLQGRMGPPPPVPLPSSSRPPEQTSVGSGAGKRPAPGPADAGRAAKR